MKKCPKCGGENSDSAEFCSLCLADFKKEMLEEEPKGKIQEQGERVVPPVTPPTSSAEPIEETLPARKSQKRSLKSKAVAVLFIVTLLVVGMTLAGVGGYYGYTGLFRKSSQSRSSDSRKSSQSKSSDEANVLFLIDEAKYDGMHYYLYKVSKNGSNFEKLLEFGRDLDLSPWLSQDYKKVLFYDTDSRSVKIFNLSNKKTTTMFKIEEEKELLDCRWLSNGKIICSTVKSSDLKEPGFDFSPDNLEVRIVDDKKESKVLVKYSDISAPRKLVGNLRFALDDKSNIYFYETSRSEFVGFVIGIWRYDRNDKKIKIVKDFYDEDLMKVELNVLYSDYTGNIGAPLIDDEIALVNNYDLSSDYSEVKISVYNPKDMKLEREVKLPRVFSEDQFSTVVCSDYRFEKYLFVEAKNPMEEVSSTNRPDYTYELFEQKVGSEEKEKLYEVTLNIDETHQYESPLKPIAYLEGNENLIFQIERQDSVIVYYFSRSENEATKLFELPTKGDYKRFSIIFMGTFD